MENFPSFVPNGFCVACSAETSLICHRCGDFYCSKNCQLKDWQRHRYICFSLPALVHPTACSALGSAVVVPPQLKDTKSNGIIAAKTEPESTKVSSNIKTNVIGGELKQEQSKVLEPPLVLHTNVDECDKKNNLNESEPASKGINNNNNNNSNIKKINFKFMYPPVVAMPANNSVVYLTGFRSPNRCFIREVSETVDKAYASICEKVNLLAQTQPKLLQVKCFDFALIKHNDQFTRVKILSVRQNSARLLYIDLGKIGLRNGAEMREISSELLQLPTHSLQIPLKYIPNYALDPKTTNFLIQFEGKRYKCNYGSDKQVHLRHMETQESMNMEIYEFGSHTQIYDKQDKQAPSPSKCATTVEKSIDHKNEASPLAKSAEEGPSNVISKPMSDIEVLLKMLETDKIPKDEVKENQQINSEKENVDNLQHILKSKMSTMSNVKTKEDSILTPNNLEKDTLENVSENFGGVNHLMNLEHITNKAQTMNPAEISRTQAMTPSKKDVQVMTPPDPTTLLAQLTRTPISAFVSEQQTPMLTAPFELRRLNVQDKEGVDVFIVENSSVSRGIIGAFDSRYAIEFSQLHSRLLNFKDPTPYKPVVKEYVIAKFKSSWYRAKVVNIKQTANECMYNVMYLEFTNTSTVSAEFIRRYPADLTMPCHTSICIIEGFPHRPTKAQAEYINEKLQMHCSLHVDSLSYLHGMAVIKCNELISQLNKMS